MNAHREKRMAPTSRRRFLTKVAGTACGVSLIGMGLGVYARQAKSLPVSAIRPPGALDEGKFQGACIRCGLCVRDCPFDVLRLSKLGQDVPLGTPYFVARDAACEMCEHIPCVEACPSGALDPNLKNIDDARMGLAAIIDHENCLAYRGLRCEVCFNVCPLRGQSISLDLHHNPRTGKHAVFIPVVHSDKCTGCGKCERACVLQEAAIKVFPLHLAKGSLGSHYRFGWKEKEKTGDSLVTPDTEHKYHLPEGVGYEHSGKGLWFDQSEGAIQQDSPFSSDPLETLKRAKKGL